jgi:starch-binding outer membrane protein, SusD/RagB family
MKKILYFILIPIFLVGCDSLLQEQKPQNSVDPSVIFKDAPGARSAIIGAYDALQSASYYGVDFLLLPDVHGGNLTHTGTFPSYAQFANRAILTDNANVTNMWSQIYSSINRVNQIIDKVPGITDPTFATGEKDQIIGEAYFLRALHYSNLVKYWGGVPIKITPSDSYDPGKIILPRATETDVYTQILADLAVAITKLPANPSNKGRASLGAAHALKTRIHLYKKEYTEAINSAILASSGYTLVGNFLDLWVVRNTSEAIFELQFNTVDTNSLSFYLLTSSTGGRNEVRPSGSLVAAYNVADTRRILSNSVDSRLRYYRAATDDDNVLLLRLAEVILNRAEALVERNTGTDLTDAVTFLNIIRNRAGIGNYAGPVTQPAVEDEIFLQRRLELALEGHYFFDLVRTGRAAANLSSPVWNNNQGLLPIPLREINASGGVLAQNPGY